jgi:hypothetical protein
MRIAVCSLYIGVEYRDIVKYGKISLEKYCEKHGYDFIYETEETPGGVYDSKRDIPWYKIPLLLKVMQKEYDFVVWNDADSQIVDYDKKLETFISEMEDKDLLVACDWESVLNTGTMFIRNSGYSQSLLQAVWDNKQPFRANLHEQASLGDIYTRNELNAQSHVIILPLHRQNEFLTYWYSYYPGKCFIVHATRCAHDRAGFIFTMDMFCTVKMEEESEEQYQDRLDWLATDRARADINHYLKGGARRNLSDRYLCAIQNK